MNRIRIVDTDEIIDNVISIDQAMGDVNSIKNICGIHPCPECEARGPNHHCGKYYEFHRFVSPPGNIMVETVDGYVELPFDTRYEVVK